MKPFTVSCVILGLICLLSAAVASGEFSILHSPTGINFKGNEALKTSELPQVISYAVGHSTQSDETWSGLSISNPFNYPKIAILLAVQGLSSLKIGEPRYPLIVTNSLQDVKDDLTFTLGKVVFDQNDIYSGNNPIYKLTKLDARSSAVGEFLKDLTVLKDLQNRIHSKTELNAVWIYMTGASRIIKEYGLDSEEANEAISLLKEEINQLEDTVNQIYGERYFMGCVTDDLHYPRVKRQAIQTRNTSYTSPYEINLSKRYDSEYSSIFNIILWTSIFLLAALISTAIFICTLDPGRDSIIYRMTTQRIKKDN